MAGDPPTLLHGIADDLRLICVDALREGGLDVPDRSYIEIGNVMAPVEFGDDCTGQLTVIAGPLKPDLATDLLQRREGKAVAGMIWKSQFTITLLRCHPMWSGDEGAPLPTPEQIDVEARKHYADVWQLSRVLAWKWAHKQLVKSFEFNGENTQWLGVTTRAPQGGIRGLDITFTVSLFDQYVPVVETPAFTS